MVTISNLSKSFGGDEIFKNISFHINPKEKIGLVGRNGHGKTTLFKMLTNNEEVENGEISMPKNYKLGYVSQHLKFSKNNVLEEGALGLSKEHKDDTWKVEKILAGLGFSTEDMNKNPNDFSGGYQVRLNLGKILVSEPNLLLLDEPTNYLDVVSIRWLAQFLKQWPNELVLITHDRFFMDSITTHTVGIHRKISRKVKGNTNKLYQQIIKEEEIYEKTRLNDEKKRKETEIFIDRFRAKARLAGMVQSRVKALEKQEKLSKMENIKSLDFSFNHISFNAKVPMKATEISFSYGKDLPLLINQFSLTIGNRDRICVIGKNGKGKTTLLKILAGVLEPTDGEIQSHLNCKKGYYAQTNSIKLNNNFTIEEELMSSGIERQEARNIAGTMMFEGDQALKKINILSGGEKSRVLLGKLLAEPSNVLFLDEPTNHLDMESCDTLMTAIDNYEGAFLMVTHNEMFLRKLANKFIVFQNNGVSIFEGTYDDFLEKIGWEDEIQEKQKDDTKENRSINRSDLRKIRAEILKRRSKEISPLEKKISKTENDIEILEKKFNNLNLEMVEASQSNDGNIINDLAKQIHESQIGIDTLYEDFENLTIEYDFKKELFEKELEELTE